ncbi:MAG: amidohydrolase [Paracoccaceae bacterium]|uniref:amidohydrolase n=1 Tax=Candidatus Salinivivens marinus TaxID=3381703 RepID=UPI000BE0049D|nr:MAG: amidohydrolase [Rhodobacteraceae bacterium MED-G08]
MPIKNRFAELYPMIVKWRHDFHRNPELQYELPKTAAKVADLLRSFGCDEVVEGVGKSGVVGVIHGQVDTSKRVIGLRADMDALPIDEKSDVLYKSEVPGVMHACGHDGHTAMLLGAAQYLCETRNFDGKAAVIFQPAEEGGAGAKAMINDGLVTRFNIDEFYGIHNMPGIETGKFAIRPGPLMASADRFKIILTGKGGHAAMPHLAVDTTLVAAQILVNLNLIVSRSIDPLKRVVVTAGTFKTDSSALNVIANTVELEGSVRSLDEDMRDLVQERLHQVAEGTAAANQCEITIEYERGYPITDNNEDATHHAISVASLVSEVDTDTPPIMPSEDFSYMLMEKPGAFIFLGNGDSQMLHNPEYIFDDEAIPFGSSWYAGMVEERLPITA